MASFIWGGSTPNTQATGSVTDQTGNPAWYQAYQRDLLSKADSVASAPYTQYAGQRLAALTPDQQQGFTNTRNTVGSWQPNMTQGSNLVGQGSNYDLNTFNNDFMNPYTNQVLNNIADISNRNFNEKIMPGVYDTFTGGGQFGSSRSMDFANRAIRDQQTGLDQQLLQNAQGEWDQAQQNYGNLQNRQIQGGQALANIGTQTQAAGLKDAAALDTIGREQQNQTQSNLDLAYQDAQNALNYPKQQAEWMSALLHGQQVQPVSNAVQSSFLPVAGQSPLAALAGATAQVASQANTTTPTTRARRGGLIQMRGR